MWLLVCGAGCVLALCTVLFVETYAAVRRPESPAPGVARQRIAVLVPAHDEELQIASTLRPITAQLAPTDRLLVVADNCSDATAAVARAAGAEVIERRDPDRRGKGYALDFGVRHLEADPPEVVVVIDADCDVGPGTLDRLVRLATASARPVQSLYLMRAPGGAGFSVRVAEFAWIIKNQVRPLGLHRLGLPCQLMGTGMAFPWPLIRSTTLASGNLVEDMKLGIDLAMAGAAPLFSPDTLVTSVFPVSDEGLRGQRKRWEHGHLLTILREAPRVFLAGITSLSASLMALGLDLAVPPLALLTMLTAVIGLAALALALLAGQFLPLMLAALAVALLAASILRAWWQFGRRTLSAGDLARAPLYALRKIPIYAGFLLSRQMEWVRSKRNGEQ